MGFDPVTVGLGLTAASGIYNAFAQNKSNNQARDQAQQNLNFQKQAYGDQSARNQQIFDMIKPYLEQQDTGIDSLVYGRGGSDFNPGQDGLMQMLRSSPGSSDPTGALTRLSSGDSRFDTSSLFDAIKASSAQDLNDQLVQSRGSAGSLGQRYGTAQLRNEALLRARSNVGNTMALTQAGASAWENAQNRSLNAAQTLGTFGQQDAARQQGYAQLIGQLLAGKTQAGNAKTLGLLGILSGQPQAPTPQGQIVPQTNGYPEAIGDIGNLALLYPFLRSATGSTPTSAPTMPNFGPLPPVQSTWLNPYGR